MKKADITVIWNYSKNTFSLYRRTSGRDAALLLQDSLPAPSAGMMQGHCFTVTN